MALRTSLACVLLAVVLSTVHAFHTQPLYKCTFNSKYASKVCRHKSERSERMFRMKASKEEPQAQERDPRRERAERLADEMRKELPQLFDLTYEPKWGLYAEKVRFIDPLNEFEGVAKYKSNIKMLKDSPLFGDSKMDLHDAVVQEDGSLITRWTLAMTFKPFPWKPRLLFTGTSQYFMDEAGLVTRHVDKWDSIDQQSPFSQEALGVLIKQMLPDITKQGVQVLKGGNKEDLVYTVVRKTAIMEVRKYAPFEIIQTEDEGVYSRETYEAALDQLRSYRGDALTKPSNKAGTVLPTTDPLLQIDNGSGCTSLAYVHATSKRGKAPQPMDKTLEVKARGSKLVAVYSVRGFGADRTRDEEVVQRYVTSLREAAASEGFKILDDDKFTIASYADGYEVWVRVEAKPEALRVRSER